MSCSCLHREVLLQQGTAARYCSTVLQRGCVETGRPWRACPPSPGRRDPCTSRSCRASLMSSLATRKGGPRNEEGGASQRAPATRSRRLLRYPVEETLPDRKPVAAMRDPTEGHVSRIRVTIRVTPTLSSHVSRIRVTLPGSGHLLRIKSRTPALSHATRMGWLGLDRSHVSRIEPRGASSRRCHRDTRGAHAATAPSRRCRDACGDRDSRHAKC